ncbi:MAG: hypothetical protein M3133_11090 [Actinomycetota bacterium]|nr:hypothetical protein [Actinomycetota bacterium]
MATSGRQPVVRRRTVVALSIAGTILVPLALPAVAENLSSGTAAVTAPVTGLLTTTDKGTSATTGTVQKIGNGTPVQPVTNTASNTAQKTVTGAAGILRQPANPAPAVVPAPGAPPAPAPAPITDAINPAPMATDTSSLAPSPATPGSASGLSVDAATLLLADGASVPPLVAEALAASPSALVLVAEPLARSLNLPLGAPGAPTSETEQVQPARNLPQGLLTEALVAVALLIAATAALVAELGLKRSAPRAT